MNRHSKCLITGCDFLDVGAKRWIHGDLHQLLDVLIFNAHGCDWNYKPLEPESMAVYATVFHESHKQFVFPLAVATFNEAAHNFLQDMLRSERADEPRIIVAGPNSVN